MRNNNVSQFGHFGRFIVGLSILMAGFVAAYAFFTLYKLPDATAEDSGMIEPFPHAVIDLNSAYATNDHTLNQLLNDPNVPRKDKELVLAKQSLFYKNLSSLCKTEKSPDNCALQNLKSNTLDLVIAHSQASTKLNKEKK